MVLFFIWLLPLIWSSICERFVEKIFSSALKSKTSLLWIRICNLSLLIKFSLNGLTLVCKKSLIALIWCSSSWYSPVVSVNNRASFCTYCFLYSFSSRALVSSSISSSMIYSMISSIVIMPQTSLTGSLFPTVLVLVTTAIWVIPLLKNPKIGSSLSAWSTKTISWNRIDESYFSVNSFFSVFKRIRSLAKRHPIMFSLSFLYTGILLYPFS